jgi:hypothetical protein
LVVLLRLARFETVPIESRPLNSDISEFNGRDFSVFITLKRSFLFKERVFCGLNAKFYRLARHLFSILSENIGKIFGIKNCNNLICRTFLQ